MYNNIYFINSGTPPNLQIYHTITHNFLYFHKKFMKLRQKGTLTSNTSNLARVLLIITACTKLYGLDTFQASGPPTDMPKIRKAPSNIKFRLQMHYMRPVPFKIKMITQNMLNTVFSLYFFTSLPRVRPE